MSAPVRRSGAVPGAALGVVLAGLAATASGQELPGLGRDAAQPGAVERPISTESSSAEDRAIERRLREIFQEIEGLGGVTVETRAGVVKLAGQVLSSVAREKALRIAGQLQGVVEVRDEIREERDLQRRLRPVLEGLRDRALGWVAALPLFVVSIVIFALFVAAGRLLTRWEAPYRRLTANAFARDLARQAVRLAFGVAGVLVALQVLDATALVAAVAGVAGLAGLALSFAFRDLAENYIASVLLSLRQPFLAHEHVAIDGHEGRVVRLTPRATILLNLDGNHVRIPNAAVFKGTIVNYSRNPRRRFVFSVGVANDADLGQALRLGVATLQQIPGVLDDPPPQAWVAGLGDWNVALGLAGWVDQRETDWLRARGEAMRLVKEAFDAAGIVMPEPTLNVRGPGQVEEAPQPQPVAPVQLEVDLSPDTEIERAVAEDRARSEEDLLDPSRPRE